MQVKGAGFGDSTSIDYEKVDTAVDNIKTDANGIDSLFGDFRKSMNVIYQPEVLEGKAGDTVQEKFDELQKKLDSYVEEVEKFAAAIDKAKNKTEATEKNVGANAENLGH
jgi:uncharacterized protein YukE